MSELETKPPETEVSLDTRRAFLKKAGLAVGAATALYVVPSFTSVGAPKAYAAITGPPVIKVSPANGATLLAGRVHLFSWEQLQGIRSYVLVLYRGRECAGFPVNTPVNTNETSFNIFVPDIGRDADYSWKVFGRDNSGVIVSESECCWFRADSLSTP